jgi:hypothetical protein
MDIYVRLHLLQATLLVLASYRLQRQAVYVAKRRPASWCTFALSLSRDKDEGLNACALVSSIPFLGHHTPPGNRRLCGLC